MSEKTIKDRYSVLHNFRELIRSTATRYATDITAADCERWIRQSHLSPSSEKGYYNRLNAFFNWCVDNNLRGPSPLESVEKPRHNRKRVPEYLTAEELEMLNDAIFEDYHTRIKKYHEGAVIWLIDLINVAARTGLRQGALCVQRWCNTDLTNGFFHVRAYGDFTPKWGSERSVPLSERVISILKRVKREQTEKGHLEARSTVFKGPTGSTLHPSNVTKRFLQYRKEALPQREEIGFHSLQHTCASWMVQDGVDLYRVQQIMGHQKYETTLKYAHLQDGHLHDAVDGL